MSVLLVPLALLGALSAVAVAGPALVRNAAPLLMRAPRAAVALLVGGLLVWLLAAAALSLMLAWTVTGPAVLPGPVGDVCQRCLDAASPFSSLGTVETIVPVVLLVLLPGLTLIGLVAGGVPGWRRRRRATATVSRGIHQRAQRTTVAGHRVLMVRDDRPLAFSLPSRAGGVVISDGLCSALLPDELAAVLEHEREHVRGRHHGVLSLLHTVTGRLRWIPFVAAIADAVPHYLEIAADDAARRRTGTTALAGALLKLGSPQELLTASVDVVGAGPVLHAAGPDRIAHLVSPPRVASAVLPASALSIVLATFLAVTVLVHGPYLHVILTGCQLPV